MSNPQPLIVRTGGQAYQVPPGQGVMIGRELACDIVMDDTRISRRHVQVLPKGNGWVLRDRGTNGTFINGQRVRGDVPLEGRISTQVGDANGTEVIFESPLKPGSTGHDFPRPGQQAPSGPQQGGPQPGGPAYGSGPMPQQGGPAYGSGPMPQQGGPGGPGDTSYAPTHSIHEISGQVRMPSGPLPGGPQAPGAGVGAKKVPLPTPPGQPGPDAITIGRGLENDIVLDDLLASRHHARVIITPGGYMVEDLGSRNGTYVNGMAVQGRMPLAPGSLLSIGHANFLLHEGFLVATVDEGDIPFVATNLSFTLPNGKQLLDDISFAMDGSSLVAVVGPSGAGKSTLLRALIGSQQATEGNVFYDGRDLYENYADLRHRIGVVPQDDVVHTQLTVRQALRFAAELRFPDDLPKSDREQRVEEVIEELGLTQHATTRISNLSGGQRKRTSVALELLTRPSLLFLDEPTSGLDPGLDKQVMNTLRRLADGGRTVVVITHAVANLDVCDAVMLLAPGGKVAYYGPPDRLLEFCGAQDHADVFTQVAAEPQMAQDRYRNSWVHQQFVADKINAPRPAPRQQHDEEGPNRQQSIGKQLSTLVRRQVQVILSDRAYLAFMLVLPAVLAVLAMVVPGEVGLAVQPDTNSGEPTQVLIFLILGATFMGTASSVRELVGERAIFYRERAVGLSPQAYLGSKLFVFAVLAIIQCTIMVLLATLAKAPPENSVLLGQGTVELIAGCTLCAFAAVTTGLAISSIAQTNEQVLPALVIAIMVQLVFCAAIIPIDGRPVLEQLAWLAPSRWGFSAAASTVGLNDAMFIGIDKDPLWASDAGHWLLAGSMLLVLAVIYSLITLWRLRRKVVT